MARTSGTKRVLLWSGMRWLLGLLIFAAIPAAVMGQAGPRCLLVELYVDDRSDESDQVVARVRSWADRNGRVQLVMRDVTSEENERRWSLIAKHYKVSTVTLPAAYGLNRVVVSLDNTDRTEQRLAEITTLEVFVRKGCSRCAEGKIFVKQFLGEYPFLNVIYRDLVTERQAGTDLQQLIRRHQQGAASVPVFHIADQLVIGYDRTGSTADRLRKLCERWTKKCEEETASRDASTKLEDRSLQSHKVGKGVPRSTLQHSALGTAGKHVLIASVRLPRNRLVWPVGATSYSLVATVTEDALPLPSDAEDMELELPVTSSSESDTNEVDLPVFGKLRVSDVGLPVFTVLIGLVDGFNPCAMWVLLILLSVLVNLKSRSRILSVAGTFVLVSGLAYFAFMAAWLNIFLLIGFLRPIQISLGLIAMVIGGIHIKDFFAFKEGVSLSIPESAKPGLYSRIRRIVTAENLWGAIIGAIVLAVLVNIVELLCTAGLPALYTEILTLHELPAWKNYAYLGLYNVAYMFDDALMVAIVVVTLGRHRLQETHGRWLKLLSGAVIFALGFVLLIHPEWISA